MSLAVLLGSWLFWAAPTVDYGPRPMVAPVVNHHAQSMVFIRETWQGDALYWRDLKTSETSIRLWQPPPQDLPQGRSQGSTSQWVLDELYWSGDQALLVKAHLSAHVPSLWWLEWSLDEQGQPVQLKSHQITPKHWTEGERRGARVVDVGPGGQVLFSMDLRQAYQPDLYRWTRQAMTDTAREPLGYRVVEVNPGGVLHWRVDNQGGARLRQSYQVQRDNVQYRWEWRQEPYGAWTLLDSWQLSEPAWRPLRFMGEDQLWVYAETEQRDTYGLHSLGLLGGAVGESQIASTTADMRRVWWSQLVGKPALVEWDSLLPTQRALLPTWQHWQKQLKKHNPQSHWLLRQVDETRAQALVAEVDGRGPQRWYRYQAENDQLQSLGQTWPTPEVSAEQQASTQTRPKLIPLRWQSDDGLNLSGYYQPALRDGLAVQGQAPLLVLVHGGPWSRDRYQYDPFAAAVARMGIAVLKVNFRGSSGGGRDFLMASQGEWGKSMQRDLLSGIEQIRQRGWLDEQRVCIAGMSYGGYAALQGVLSQPQQFRCAMAHAPVTDLAQHIRWLEQQGNHLGAAEWRYLVGDPAQDQAALAEVSPLARAASLARPVLLSHGHADGVVDPIQSLQFHAQAPKLWLHWQSIEGGHALEQARQRQQLWNRWLQFLQAYLLSGNSQLDLPS